MFYQLKHTRVSTDKLPCVRECVAALFYEHKVIGNPATYRLPIVFCDELYGEAVIDWEKVEAAISKLSLADRIAIATNSDDAAPILELDENLPANLGYVSYAFNAVFYDVHDDDGMPKDLTQ